MNQDYRESSLNNCDPPPEKDASGQKNRSWDKIDFKSGIKLKSILVEIDLITRSIFWTLASFSGGGSQITEVCPLKFQSKSQRGSRAVH